MTLIEKRKAKYPDTKTFHYHNANPKNKITTDCVIRALSVGLQMSYNDVVMELAAMQCSTGFDDGDTELIDRYLKSKGWIRCKQPRKFNNKKYTGEEFCIKLAHPVSNKDLNLYSMPYDRKRVIADLGGHHIVSVVEGKVWDTWNSTDGCIGIVWVNPC